MAKKQKKLDKKYYICKVFETEIKRLTCQLVNSSTIKRYNLLTRQLVNSSTIKRYNLLTRQL